MMARRVIVGAKRRLWTPHKITTALWLDAADANTITKDESNLVSQWNDKSGNGRHATQTSNPLKLTLTANTQNGLPVASGSGKWMVLPAEAMPTEKFICVGVVSVASNAAGKAIIGRAYYWGSFYISIIPANAATSPRKLRLNVGVNGVSEAAAYSSSNADGTPVIFTAAYDKLNVASAVNGESFVQTPYTPNITYHVNDSATLCAFRTGAASTASEINGWCGEIILINQAWDDASRRRLEGYLAHKWGLTANLPANHPYKFSPPRA